MSDATPAPTPVVVDAGVGLKWYVTEVHSARRPVCSAKSSSPTSQATSTSSWPAVWKKVMLRGELTEDQARDVRTQWTRFRS